MICLLLASSCSILLFSHSVNADLITKVSANTTAVVDFNVRQFVQQLLRTSDSVSFHIFKKNSGSCARRFFRATFCPVSGTVHRREDLIPFGTSGNMDRAGAD